jgi:hypothetical protein
MEGKSRDDRRRCVRIKKNSERCKNPRLGGSTQCNHHSLAPQIRRKAWERLLEAADPVMAEMVRLFNENTDMSPADKIRLAFGQLDRAGYGPRTTQINVDAGKVDYEIVGVDMEAV